MSFKLKKLELKALIESIKYKPNTELKYYDLDMDCERFSIKRMGVDDCVELVLKRKEIDSKDHSKTTIVMFNRTFTLYELELGSDYWCNVIYRFLIDSEIHELEEFLFFNNTQYRSPH